MTAAGPLVDTSMAQGAHARPVSAFRESLKMSDRMQMYINGQWKTARSGKTLGVINPATEDVLLDVPYGSRADVHEAVEAAGAAFPAWSHTTAYERASILKKVADLIRERLEAMALKLTQEQGKTLFESRAEMAQSAANFEWMAEECKRSYGQIIPQTLPNKRPHFDSIRQKFGVEFSQMVFFDNQSDNVALAKSMGITAVYVPGGLTKASWNEVIAGCKL